MDRPRLSQLQRLERNCTQPVRAFHSHGKVQSGAPVASFLNSIEKVIEAHVCNKVSEFSGLKKVNADVCEVCFPIVFSLGFLTEEGHSSSRTPIILNMLQNPLCQFPGR